MFFEDINYVNPIYVVKIKNINGKKITQHFKNKSDAIQYVCDNGMDKWCKISVFELLS